MSSENKLLDNLNSVQKKAVLDTEGPNLIYAGAGSGKTRASTTKLAYIISEKRAWPNQVLRLLNKAAKEMQNRVLGFIKGKNSAVPWLGTFHSLALNF